MQVKFKVLRWHKTFTWVQIEEQLLHVHVKTWFSGGFFVIRIKEFVDDITWYVIWHLIARLYLFLFLIYLLLIHKAYVLWMSWTMSNIHVYIYIHTLLYLYSIDHLIFLISDFYSHNLWPYLQRLVVNGSCLCIRSFVSLTPWFSLKLWLSKFFQLFLNMTKNVFHFERCMYCFFKRRCVFSVVIGGIKFIFAVIIIQCRISPIFILSSFHYCFNAILLQVSIHICRSNIHLCLQCMPASKDTLFWPKKITMPKFWLYSRLLK